MDGGGTRTAREPPRTASKHYQGDLTLTGSFQPCPRACRPTSRPLPRHDPRLTPSSPSSPQIPHHLESPPLAASRPLCAPAASQRVASLTPSGGLNQACLSPSAVPRLPLTPQRKQVCPPTRRPLTLPPASSAPVQIRFSTRPTFHLSPLPSS